MAHTLEHLAELVVRPVVETLRSITGRIQPVLIELGCLLGERFFRYSGQDHQSQMQSQS